MGWTLEQVRDMDAAEFDALVEWAVKRAENNDPDSIDADAIVEAKQNKQKANEDA